MNKIVVENVNQNTTLMKKSMQPLKIILFILTLAFVQNTNAQLLKKLGKRAEKAAERTLERRVEQETANKTDKVLDSILQPGSKKGDGRTPSKPEKSAPKTSSDKQQDTSSNTNGNTEDLNTSAETASEAIEVYRKFDFVPGDELLFFDDFSTDFIGDFPSKWNTNSGGELVSVNTETGKWLKLMPGHKSRYLPDISNLPEEFTLEFDVMTTGLNKKTSSQSYFMIMVGDNNTFNRPTNFAMVEYPLCQFIDPGTIVENNINGEREIRNSIKVDIRNTVLQKHRISLAVNKQRFRMWMNEQKIVDVPRLLPADKVMQGIKFGLRGVDTNVENLYVSNFKIAAGGVDLRRKLLSEGKISTNGILFDSGSADIQAQSMGIIRQIYQVLEQDKTIRLNIVGHTDTDGDDVANIELSKKRAEAVKNALISVYGVSSDRLATEGKGESEPITNNSTPEEKLRNRRVEFIRIL